MRNGFDHRFLASTALAVLMTVSGNAIAAPTTDEAAIEAAIPVPEPANVAPLTINDVAPANAIPVPEPANVPPPSLKDVMPQNAAPAEPKPAKAEAPQAPEPAKAEAAKPTEKAEPATGSKPTDAADSKPATDAKPQTADAVKPADSVNIKSLTGKDLVKAPIAHDLAGADAETALALRQILATKLASYVEHKSDRTAVEVFYRDRGFAPLWVSNGQPSARGAAAGKFLRGIEADGLDPEDYPVPSFSGNAQDQAKAELELTQSVLTFARQASTGRVAFSRVSAAILFQPEAPKPEQVLAKIATAADVAAALDLYNPQQPGYKALKAKLAERRGHPVIQTKVVHIPDGATLRAGDSSPRVLLLRKRLEIGDRDNPRYDKVVAKAVQEFQEKAGLQPDGLVGPNTLAHLNGESRPHGNAVDTIIANMERWRWLPRDLGKSYVMVNIPDFTLRVVDHGKTVWSTRIVTGQPGNKATPLLTETMKFITVNPTWNVPPSIIRNEYIPVLEQDPDALERAGIKVEHNPDGTVRMYQPPGPHNALGRIRFNFPNVFLVYQHDTPDKYLFDKPSRAYSHGCMRVQNPEKYAEVLLSISQPGDDYTIERIRRMYGDSERNITLKHPIPVHVTYQTAFVDADGKLEFRKDVYGLDEKVLELMRGHDRRVADIPIVRDYKSSSKPVYADLPVEPQSFFGGLFGGSERRYDPRYAGPRYRGSPRTQNAEPRDPRYDANGRRYAGPNREQNIFQMLFR